MTDGGWQLFFTKRRLPLPRTGDEVLASTASGLDGWLDRHGVREGSPYLIDPVGGYDVDLNGYFAGYLGGAPLDTQRAAGYDLRRWLSFLWDNRDRVSWRTATSVDRAAFQRWRLVDPGGPRVAATTWDREVATVNQFYLWAVRGRLVATNPIIGRETRSRRPGASGGSGVRGSTPAEATHQGSRRDVAWLPPRTYQRWRDVGVRGFGVDGLPDAAFRGRFAARNAAFTDLLIRTGLRLSEQASLSVFELPERVDGVANARTWLPAAIAKCGSARSVYIPAASLTDVWDYVELERAQAIETARDRGVYDRICDPLIVTDRRRPVVVIGSQRVRVDKLDRAERRRVLIRTRAGLEPAALWLTEAGLPSAPSGWQQVFKNANRRCAGVGVGVGCSAHMLRHSLPCQVHQEPGQVTHIDRLNPPVRATRSQNPAPTAHPRQPPRNPAHVLARAQHHPRPDHQPPLRRELPGDRRLTSRLGLTVDERTRHPLPRPLVRVSRMHRRGLRDRLAGPVPVDRHGRHEHVPLRRRGQGPRRVPHHSGHRPRHVDHRVPRPMGRQRGQAGRVLTVTAHQADAVREPRRSPTPVEHRDLTPGGDGLLNHRGPDEPGAPQHKHTHPPIIPSRPDAGPAAPSPARPINRWHDRAMNSGADVRKAAARLPRMLEQLGELVEAESPSYDPAALVAYPAARDLPQPPT